MCLFVCAISVTLSPIPSRPIPIDRAWYEKKNDIKIMGAPLQEKLKNQFFHFRLLCFRMWSEMKTHLFICLHSPVGKVVALQSWKAQVRSPTLPKYFCFSINVFFVEKNRFIWKKTKNGKNLIFIDNNWKLCRKCLDCVQALWKNCQNFFSFSKKPFQHHADSNISLVFSRIVYLCKKQLFSIFFSFPPSLLTHYIRRWLIHEKFLSLKPPDLFIASGENE